MNNKAMQVLNKSVQESGSIRLTEAIQGLAIMLDVTQYTASNIILDLVHNNRLQLTDNGEGVSIEEVSNM